MKQIMILALSTLFISNHAYAENFVSKIEYKCTNDATHKVNTIDYADYNRKTTFESDARKSAEWACKTLFSGKPYDIKIRYY